ncbi:lytic transglycosylase [Pikeienuella piscinae]|uniref:Lytic transglycosylase n=1 Tax=Pikeienuella piscinae TaxID=2748098 RepID=A0A7L5BW59_9RHOB|nr:transglycosylase SLT domain-containing protein [Pikeienuella piscinae]QIE54777.1 lytic transglycosylase [Pikeienuella piscinae]
MKTALRPATWAAATLLLAACSSTPSGPPRNQADACSVLEQRSDWGEALAKTQRRWGAPPDVVMAIIWRESSFRADARPPKQYTFLGLIPNGRVSSAYGYPQALDGTWDWYREETGASGADRGNFDDAVDFVGWYLDKTQRMNGLSKSDAYGQYLAYHEGHTGYSSGRWRQKGWLLNTASQVAARAESYRAQLARCATRVAAAPADPSA